MRLTIYEWEFKTVKMREIAEFFTVMVFIRAYLHSFQGYLHSFGSMLR